MKTHTISEIAAALGTTITQLLVLNAMTREQGICKRHQITASTYARDYCTIALEAGRQNGKTRWIAANASARDIVIVTNVTHREEFLSFGPALGKERVFTTLEITLGTRPFPTEWRNCYVDSATNVFARLDKVTLYKKLIPDTDKHGHQFVLLG